MWRWRELNEGVTYVCCDRIRVVRYHVGAVTVRSAVLVARSPADSRHGAFHSGQVKPCVSSPPQRPKRLASRSGGARVCTIRRRQAHAPWTVLRTRRRRTRVRMTSRC